MSAFLLLACTLPYVSSCMWHFTRDFVLCVCVFVCVCVCARTVACMPLLSHVRTACTGGCP